MQRIRAIVPSGKNSIFYNLDDLFSFLGINKDIFLKSIYEHIKSCKKAGLFIPQKVWDKYSSKEEIKGTDGVQEHIYCHKEFFKYFCSSEDLILITKLLNSED
jgi:hypothetical protein